mmetsp:Transcript_27210/g.59915  ORF Transcript_27210/g.59915 Transcript_27210/m.59915 type:complete len:202 (-) Transcript_27210:130-735(-)
MDSPAVRNLGVVEKFQIGPAKLEFRTAQFDYVVGGNLRQGKFRVGGRRSCHEQAPVRNLGPPFFGGLVVVFVSSRKDDCLLDQISDVLQDGPNETAVSRVSVEGRADAVRQQKGNYQACKIVSERRFAQRKRQIVSCIEERQNYHYRHIDDAPRDDLWPRRSVALHKNSNRIFRVVKDRPGGSLRPRSACHLVQCILSNVM